MGLVGIPAWFFDEFPETGMLMGQAKHWPSVVLNPTSSVSRSEAGDTGSFPGGGARPQGSWTCHPTAPDQLASAEFCICCLSQSLDTQSTELTHRSHR